MEAFEKARKCLNDDLNWVQIALEEAEAREHEAVADCQYALKMFKFKRYKVEYADGKRGVSPR